MSSGGRQNIRPTLGSLTRPLIIANTFLNSVTNQFPSSQLQRGDLKLIQAREIAYEYESVISESDQSIIEERITL